MDTNKYLQDKISETLDTYFLNNYNMDDNSDKYYDHTFFSEIDPNINVSNTNESLYFNEDDFNNNSNNLSLFISTYVAYRTNVRNLNYFYLTCITNFRLFIVLNRG